MYQPTEIVMLPFPFTDLSSIKKRPVLVMTQADNRGDMLVAQITSKSSYLDAVPIVASDVLQVRGESLLTEMSDKQLLSLVRLDMNQMMNEGD